ncbi:MAG: hypothetical protein HYV97_03170 [Bdellovibrio sp.]|nr:hypothetical protein [Bdellovibrio sp.]
MKSAFLLFIILPYSSLTFAIDCPEGTRNVIAHFRSDYTRIDGTYVRSAEVKESCRKYSFLRPSKLLFLHKTPTAWPNRNEKFIDWSAKEKQEISNILKSLPKALTQVGTLKLHRARTSKWEGNAATSLPEENIITFYNNVSSYKLRNVLTHELSHILWKNLDQNEREKYFSIADWILNSKGEIFNQRAIVSEEDGRTSPEEDFANNVEHLLTNKNYDQKISPLIVNCLKQIIGIKR